MPGKKIVQAKNTTTLDSALAPTVRPDSDGCSNRQIGSRGAVQFGLFANALAPFPFSLVRPPGTSWTGRADAGYRNEWKFKSAKPKQVSQVPSQARGQASGEHSFRERKQQTTSAMFARQVSRKHPEEQEEEQALTREQKEEDARLAHVM